MHSHSLRIAIVDDDAAVLDSTRLLLEVAGFSVETFASPCEFLAQAANSNFDRLILDQHMPHLTGLELARRLRATGNTVPIMLITGALTEDIVARANEMHLEQVAEKPTSAIDLMHFVAAA